MNVKLEENVSLKDYNTYKIEAKCRYFAHVLNIDGLKEIIKYAKDLNVPYFVIGCGSNIVIDEYFSGIVIKLEDMRNIKIDGSLVTIEAGAKMGKLATSTVNHNLTGLEWAINIPGTVGGSIVGNAGAYNSEIRDNLVNIKVLTPDLEIKTLNKDDIKWDYRSTSLKGTRDIVIEATFKLAKGNKEESLELIKDRCDRRMATQPLDMPSAGSVFRNPLNDHAGRLIEQANLKGKRIGDAEVSLKHANFIVNTGNATSKDIKNLIKLVHDEVKSKFGVDLILEQEIIDWKN